MAAISIDTDHEVPALSIDTDVEVRAQGNGISEGYEEVHTPTENDLMISRLVARIAELEEKLYKKELEAPTFVERPQPQPQPPQPAPTPKLKDSIINTLKESWAKLESYQVQPPNYYVPGSYMPQAAALGQLTPPAPASTPQPARTPTLTPVPMHHAEPEQQQQQLDNGDAGATSSSLSSPRAAEASQTVGTFAFKTPLVVNYDQPVLGSPQDRAGLSTTDAGASTAAAAPGADGSAGPAQHIAAADKPTGPGASQASSEGGVSAASTSTATIPPVARSAPSATGGTASRAAEWFSKLSLPWGRDRSAQQSQDGSMTPPPGSSKEGRFATLSSLSRNVSNGSLYGLQQGPGPLGPALGPEASFNEKALEEQLTNGGQYYRYVFDPVDVQAEMEVTARVRRAAAEALMEANAKLAEAEAAQQALRAQLEEFKELEKEVDALKAERSSIASAKLQVEDEVAAVRLQLDQMKDTETSLQAELEGMRAQADIWKSSTSAESEKLKQENQVLRNQLTTRLSELQTCRNRLAEGEAERQRITRDTEELHNKIQWLTKINMQLENAASQVDGLRKAASEWQERFMRERNVRRKLHDEVQQIKGNIRVLCRVRPVQAGQKDIITYPLEGLMAVAPPDRRYQEFEFDHVFGPSASQAGIFEEAVQPLVRSCADGYNVCIFAYGQTGSGKTHTMQGPMQDPGINVRALQELFRIAKEEGAGASSAGGASASPSKAPVAPSAAAEGGAGGLVSAGSSPLGRWHISVSMLEIYNEAVHDLLGGAEAATKPMDVSALAAGELPPGVDRVPGLMWRAVSTTAEVEEVLREGSRARATASTALNASSSRSHALLSVRVACAQPDGRQVVSTMHLVDLAGSERVDKSEVSGQQLKEAQSINKSLSALGDVIAALQRRNSHIPFRNSKLTAVLQDSLCGNSKVLLVCNVSPESQSASETISSLNFASRAAQVELGTARRASASSGSASVERSPAPEQAAAQARVPSGGSGAQAGTPPLPIMNGTAAKVRAASGVRASQQQGLRG